MRATSIGDALFTKTQQRVLGLLYGTPDKSFYTNEIMRWANMGRGTIRRELERLVSAGILSVTPTGNQNHYQAKQDNPIYSELLGIVRKTFGIADVIKQALTPLNDRIDLAFIYGSIAKFADTKTSDIDLMLVGGGLHYGDVLKALMLPEESLGRSISPTVFTSAEFASRLDQNSSFLVRVMEQPKIFIVGTIDGSGESGTDWATEKGAT